MNEVVGAFQRGVLDPEIVDDKGEGGAVRVMTKEA